MVEDDEVRKNVFQMHPYKSPGPDGFNPYFYQKYLDVVGEDIVKMVRYFFTTGELPDRISEAHIYLIPKTTKSEINGDL